MSVPNNAPWTIFSSEIGIEAVRCGLGESWVECNRARVVLWWNSGELLDEARRMVRFFGEGKRLADMADRDGMDHIRRAARCAEVR